MKQRLILALVTVIAFAGCNGFEYSSFALKNNSITYIVSGNGRDYETYAFDKTGKSGTFESGSYEYRYTNKIDYDAGTYSKKDWVMVNGLQGDFTYNPDTKTLLITYTGGWTQSKGATSFGTGYYAPTDYSWTSYTDYYIGHGATDNNENATHTIESNFVSNSDSSLLTAYILDKNNSLDGTYIYRYKETENLSYTTGGKKHSIVTETSSSYTISELNLIINNTMVKTETEEGRAPEIEHNTKTTEYTINNYFLKGSDTTGMSFNSVWDKNNTVTFTGEQTKQSVIEYTGDTAPSEPSVSATTGLGYTSAANGTYTVSQEGGTTISTTLVNMNSYIYPDIDAITRSMILP